MTTPTPAPKRVAKLLEAGRVRTVCDQCLAVDDHPKILHLFGAGDVPPVEPARISAVVGMPSLTDEERTRVLEELVDPASASRHRDCCAATGCAECRTYLDALGHTGQTGEAMLKLVTGSKAATAQRAVEKLLEANAPPDQVRAGIDDSGDAEEARA